MTEPIHPSTCIDTRLTDELRNLSAGAENAGSLLPAQLDIIYNNKWFKLFVPKQYGGLELTLPEALRMEEALAWVDGSTGWTVTLCSGANWFIGFLTPGTAKELFTNHRVYLAGSGRPSGIARVTGNGYEITGSWKYATGAPHATVFTANCLIEKEGELVKDESGNPLMHAFWFYRKEVIIHEDWNAIGMIATASHSFEVKQLKVPANRCFNIDSTKTVLPHPVYKFPFLQFAEATLAVNSSGMAVHFFDLCKGILEEKNKTSSQPGAPVLSTETFTQKLAEATDALQKARTVFYKAVEQSWEALVKENSVKEDLLREVSTASRNLAALSLQWVDILYPFCGLIAASPESGINRVWRDLHTASQHSLLTSREPVVVSR